MATTVALHRVADYDAWRKVYDNLAEVQKAGGVVDEAVFRMEGDPDNVLVRHRFSTMEQAHAFFESPELQSGMKEAGVDLSSLRLEFYEET